MCGGGRACGRGSPSPSGCACGAPPQTAHTPLTPPHARPRRASISSSKGWVQPSGRRASAWLRRYTAVLSELWARVQVLFRAKPCCCASGPFLPNCGQQMGTPPRIAVPGAYLALELTKIRSCRAHRGARVKERGRFPGTAGPSTWQAHPTRPPIPAMHRADSPPPPNMQRSAVVPCPPPHHAVSRLPGSQRGALGVDHGRRAVGALQRNRGELPRGRHGEASSGVMGFRRDWIGWTEAALPARVRWGSELRVNGLTSRNQIQGYKKMGDLDHAQAWKFFRSRGEVAFRAGEPPASRGRCPITWGLCLGAPPEKESARIPPTRKSLVTRCARSRQPPLAAHP